MLIVLKSGSLNLLEPSGPVQACNEIDLPLPFTFTFTDIYYYLSKTSSEIHILNFGYLSAGHHIDVSKDVRIRGYFSKPKVVREQKVSGNTILDENFKPSAFVKCPENFTDIIDCRFTARLFNPNMQLGRWLPRRV